MYNIVFKAKLEDLIELLILVKEHVGTRFKVDIESDQSLFWITSGTLDYNQRTTLEDTLIDSDLCVSYSIVEV